MLKSCDCHALSGAGKIWTPISLNPGYGPPYDLGTCHLANTEIYVIFILFRNVDFHTLFGAGKMWTLISLNPGYAHYTAWGHAIWQMLTLMRFLYYLEMSISYTFGGWQNVDPHLTNSWIRPTIRLWDMPKSHTFYKVLLFVGR